MKELRFSRWDAVCYTFTDVSERAPSIMKADD
jgi:hypothetical protein